MDFLVLQGLHRHKEQNILIRISLFVYKANTKMTYTKFNSIPDTN